MRRKIQHTMRLNALELERLKQVAAHYKIDRSNLVRMLINKAHRRAGLTTANPSKNGG
jgi:hypothetical protein